METEVTFGVGHEGPLKLKQLYFAVMVRMMTGDSTEDCFSLRLHEKATVYGLWKSLSV